ncbi:MAG: OmpA family protein [Candidatus Aegiribacteria sp.]|nr:OmpA family protein [Candidatus Aegiribacteria sp.]
MKKGSLIIAAILLISCSAMALPSYSGLRGLNRTVDAKTIGAGEFSLALFSFLGMSNDTRTAQLAGGAEEVTDTEYNGTWYITAGYGLSEKVEVAGRVSYIWNCLSRDYIPGREDLEGGENENDDGFSEASFFLKYAIDSSGDLRIGLMPWAGFSIYNGGDNPYVTNYNQYDGVWYPEQPMFEMRRPMIGTNLSAGADLLVSLDLHPVVVHTNIGYHYFKQNFQFTDHRYGTSDSVAVDMDVEDPVFHLAVGFEYPMNKTILFAEAEWRHFMKRDYEDGNGQDYDDMIIVQPGIRFPFASGFAFDVVGAFALDNFDPEWSDLGHHAYQAGGSPTEAYRANYAPFPEGYYSSWGVGVNLMYSSDLREGPGSAVMSGTIIDAVTGEFLEATVAFPGTAVQPAISDPETGYYSVEVPEGSIAVAVNASGYTESTETIQVSGGHDISQDYALQPTPCTIMGSVTDIETGTAISRATVIAPDVPVSDMTGNDGLYEFDLDEGNWTITASASGYLGASESVDFLSGDLVVLDFQLQSVAFEPIYFIVNQFNIQPEYKTILNSIAEEIIANGLTVQISGHSDSDYTEEYNQTLSENRAMAVYDYLVDHGVSASSLTTVGYGETRPAVPNASAANKALNRRAEFVVETISN